MLHITYCSTQIADLELQVEECESKLASEERSKQNADEEKKSADRESGNMKKHHWIYVKMQDIKILRTLSVQN